MEVNDKTPIYEINKYVPQKASTSNATGAGKQASNKEKTEKAAQTDPDTIVNLSQSSKEAQLIKETISYEPDVREAIVTQFKERIESGNYKINHEAVAGKIVGSYVDELLNS